jgi:hypothetical protein
VFAPVFAMEGAAADKPRRPSLTTYVATALTVAVAGIAFACGSDDEPWTPPQCTPVQADERESGAEEIIALVENQAAFAQDAVPDMELKQVVVLSPSGLAEFGFLYTDDNEKGAFVYPDGDDWRLSRPTEVSPDLRYAALNPIDLRNGVEDIISTFERTLLDVRVQAVSLSRNSDCELEWFVGGWMVDDRGRPRDVVEGVIDDASGAYKETRRYDFPTGP